MSLIKLTSKRQATFPVEVCKQLGVGPGDSLSLEPHGEGDETVWILKPAQRIRPAWLGCLRRHAGKGGEPWSRERHGEEAARAMAKEQGR